MGKPNKRTKLTRKQRLATRVSSKRINFNNETYTLDIYHSDKFKKGFKTVLSSEEKGVCFTGDNYPSIGDAIALSKFEYLDIDF